MDIRRGQVWWWNCPSHNRRHIQEGKRPVIIVSNDICNQRSPVVTVVPMTTSVKFPYPQQVPLVLNGRISIAIADQITSIPVDELENFVCTLCDFQMDQVDRAVAVQLGMIKPGEKTYLFKVAEDGSC